MNKIIITCLVCFAVISCNQISFESNWADYEITIDGNLEEWNGKMIVPENSHVAMSVANDNDFLYIAMRTADRNIIRQTATQGFILWFDDAGGDEKTLGIKFPTGNLVDGLSPRKPDMEQSIAEFELKIDELLQNQFEIEILGSDNSSITRLGINNPAGILVNTSFIDGLFAYEMRIPLQRSTEQPFAIDVKPGENIGIGFTTPEIDKTKMMNQMSGAGMKGRGMGGSKGGRDGGMKGGGRGGSGGGMNRQMPKSLDVWTQVFLADQK